MKRILHVVKQYEAMLTPFQVLLVRAGWILLGVAIGMLAAYILVPVQFRNNAQPVQLDDTYREQWVKSVAAEYSVRQDENEVKDKLVDAGITSDYIADLREKNSTDPELVSMLTAIEPIAEDADSQAKATAESYPEPGFMSAIMPFIIYLVLVIVGVLMAVYLSLFDDPITMIRRRFQKVDPSVKLEQEKAKARADLAKQKEVFDTPPVKQFMSIYNAGDNFYDDSFAIETPDDDRFLGECGSSIAESIGTGPQKKVAATEVWVFSQNDIATLTNIVASEHAYNDPAIRAKLEARGDVVLATQGGKANLESKSLRAQVRIIDLKYSDDPAFPPNSVFDKLAIEIAVWEKGGAGASADLGEEDMGMKLPPPIITPPPMQPQQPQAMPPQQPFAQPQQPQAMPPQQPPMQPPAQPQAMPPQQPFAQPQQPQAMPPQQPPMQPPAQPQAMPPQQPPMQAPPAQPMQPMQPQPGTMQPPQRAPQQPGTMQPPQRAPQQPGTMQPPQRPPQQPGTMQPPQQPGTMQPPQQQQPPSPYGDTNY